MIEPSKSPWACGVVLTKKKGDQLRFCCDFRYLNSVTVKDAYPITRIDESLWQTDGRSESRITRRAPKEINLEEETRDTDRDNAQVKNRERDAQGKRL